MRYQERMAPAKTIALRCPVALLQSTSGAASLGGGDALSQPLEVRRQLGFLPPQRGLYEWLE